MAADGNKVSQAAGSLVSTIHAFSQQLTARMNAADVNVHSTLNTPYKTSEIIAGREVWAIRLDFGSLPNKTTKITLLPTTVTDVWAGPGNRWIDLGYSFVYNVFDGTQLPLSYVTPVDIKSKQSTSDNISIYMTDSGIVIETESNRSDYNAVVMVKYLLNPEI